MTAGGVSGHPASPHFDDQAERYANGDLRPVHFYPDDLEGHVGRRCRPGRWPVARERARWGVRCALCNRSCPASRSFPARSRAVVCVPQLRASALKGLTGGRPRRWGSRGCRFKSCRLDGYMRHLCRSGVVFGWPLRRFGSGGGRKVNPRLTEAAPTAAAVGAWRGFRSRVMVSPFGGEDRPHLLVVTGAVVGPVLASYAFERHA
ncbi:penicillin acylase family protein [Streptomyces sp. NPDC057909]|uniref:penicillin acylase family protein n=1 Tax=Streptomyces sp. NPDC057909 TaxID=3346277 RepID=UPI0036E6E45D